MNPTPNIIATTAVSHQQEQATFIQKVYSWMSWGLLLTAVVAYFVANTPALVNIFLGNMFVFYGLLILELVVVIYLSRIASKVSAHTATMLFLFYAFLNGLTFSVIFLAYTEASIASTFLVTAGTFGLMAWYGYVTKKDLSSIGNMAFMLLIGLILASVVNLFLNNSMLYWILTYAGIGIFVALTAYDVQKIKNMNILGNEGTDEDRKEAIMGALTLYLDFINLFLYILRLMGSRK